MSEDLDRLAEAYGISLGYVNEAGTYRRVSERAKQGILAALGVAARTAEDIASSLAAAPAPEPRDMIPAGTRCFIPDWLGQGKAWGITCQLYGLRSERNWGIGDFEDLARLAEHGAASGADFVGVNPLHALFFADPSRCSPYAPSSRRFLNPLYIAVDKLDGFDQANAPAIAAAREAELVDYLHIGELKRSVLASRFAEFERDHLSSGTEKARHFQAFCRERGQALEFFARFEALSAAFVADGRSCGWHGWPDACKSPAGDAVLGFARQNPGSILFHKWLQWVADSQLAAAHRRARAAGMRIGLYLDLAVGAAPDGADTWADRSTVVGGVNVGAPPDPFNQLGQNWGLCPISPVALREQGGGAMAATLHPLMRHAGAIRIDHVMGLVRLYWIPAGLAAADGAYVGYPGAILMRRLACASQQHSALVVGEDLGTVPGGFRETMRDLEIQGYRVLYFERGEDGEFRPPQSYARETLACVSTHDLPVLRGWWMDSDIAARERLGLQDAGSARMQRAERARDRLRLLRALRRAGLLTDGPEATAGGGRVPADLPDDVLLGVHAFLARAPSRLVAVQLEDLVGMEAQANLPGTVDEHPNWRRKLPIRLEELAECATFKGVVRAVSAERGRAS